MTLILEKEITVLDEVLVGEDLEKVLNFGSKNLYKPWILSVRATGFEPTTS